MAAIASTLDAVKLMREITVTIKFRRVREFRLRLFVGKLLFRTAAWIMNCRIEIEGPSINDAS